MQIVAKQLTIVDAGALQEYVLRDRVSRYDSGKPRAQKQKATSASQKALNLKNATRHVERTLAKNFPTSGSANFVTLTYSDEMLPSCPDPADCRARVLKDKDSFLARLRRIRAKKGLPVPRAVWCIEVLTSAHNRWHVHLVLDNTGDDLEDIQRCWKGGGHIDLEPLLIDEDQNHESLARYMTKEMRELQDRNPRPGAHVWGITRSCWKYEVEHITVPDDYEIQPPESSEILDDRRESTEFASWHYVKARVGSQAFPKPARAKRRRRSGALFV